MKIAVLVHNDVVKDARVRKEVGTLVGAGHDVRVFGMTRQQFPTAYPSTVEGAPLELIDYSSLLSRSRLLNLFPMVQAAVELVLVALALLTVVFLTQYGAAWHNASAFILLVAAVLPLLCLRRFKLRLLNFVAASILAIGLLVANYLSPTTYVVVGMMTWILFRYDITRQCKKTIRTLLRRIMPNARAARFKVMAKLLAERVLQEEFDVVHCHDIIALIAGGEIKRAKPQIKLIWDAHEIYEDLASSSGEHEGKVMQKIIATNQALVDGFVTISQSFADFYGSNYRLPPARIVMNATRHMEHVPDDGRLRAAAGLDATRKILLFQGGLSPKRGMSQLMEAARILPEPWSIVAMGWGKLEGKLHAVADELAAMRDEGKQLLVVIPPAPQEELQYWTAGADIGIIPYENTGLNHLYCTPNKLWEFPNAGVPILASGLVEMERMINKWGTGFLLPRKFTARDIVFFLRTLDEKSLQEKKANCAAFSKKMGWEIFEPVLLDLYREIGDARSIKPARAAA